MERQIGVLAADHLVVGLVEGEKLLGPLRVYPSERAQPDLHAMPAETVAQTIRTLIEPLSRGQAIQAVGVGFPGIIRGGVIEDSPNLQQVKGFNLQAALAGAQAQDAR